MTLTRPKPMNIHKREMVPTDLKIVGRALRLAFDPSNRAVQRDKGLSVGDVLFNLVRVGLLDETLRKYRHTVKFGDQYVFDGTFPPYPSPAFDKRVSNYVNNLDITETPSSIVSISTTNCCPYNCSFCSTDSRRNPENDLPEELLKRTIAAVESLDTPTIILHGGEPFYRYDRFLRLVKHVSPDTCLWMFTTGYDVTDDKAAELKENGLFGVWVSLDHHKPEIHNRLRGHRNAFDNACKAIESFQRAGVYTCLSLVPPPDLCEREGFVRYYDFAKELGAAEIRVLETKPSGRERVRGVTPHSPVLAKLQKDLFRDPAFQDHPPLSGLSTWLEKDEAFGCQCRFEYLFITGQGDVQPCEVSEISFGNIKEEEFPTIYRRACDAFPRPSTGCIPMVVHTRIRDYLKIRDTLSSQRRGELAAEIMDEFRKQGWLPGSHKGLWRYYMRRLNAYRSRKARRNAAGVVSNEADRPQATAYGEPR